MKQYCPVCYSRDLDTAGNCSRGCKPPFAESAGYAAEAEALARRFHEAYERLAPQYGYKTRTASAVPWEQVPEQNKNLMIAVCAELLPHIAQAQGRRA